MDGTIADLAALHALATRYECALMVDDAHGFGLPYRRLVKSPTTGRYLYRHLW